MSVFYYIGTDRGLRLQGLTATHFSVSFRCDLPSPRGSIQVARALTGYQPVISRQPRASSCSLVRSYVLTAESADSVSSERHHNILENSPVDMCDVLVACEPFPSPVPSLTLVCHPLL